MENINLLTGEELNSSEQQNLKFKKMCINCQFVENIDGQYVCSNEDNKKNAIEKVKAALPSGYEITELNLKPLPLKVLNKKCKAYETNWTDVLEYIKNNSVWE